MTQPRYFGGLRGPDMKRCCRIQKRLGAANATETIRRALITMETLLEHQTKGDVVLCKKGLPDKVVWFV